MQPLIPLFIISLWSCFKVQTSKQISFPNLLLILRSSATWKSLEKKKPKRFEWFPVSRKNGAVRLTEPAADPRAGSRHRSLPALPSPSKPEARALETWLGPNVHFPVQLCFCLICLEIWFRTVTRSSLSALHFVVPCELSPPAARWQCRDYRCTRTRAGTPGASSSSAHFPLVPSRARQRIRPAAHTSSRHALRSCSVRQHNCFSVFPA